MYSHVNFGRELFEITDRRRHLGREKRRHPAQWDVVELD